MAGADEKSSSKNSRKTIWKQGGWMSEGKGKGLTFVSEYCTCM